MRALLVIALVALLLPQPSAAQNWIGAIAQAEPAERVALARRAAEAELGPAPRGGAARADHERRVSARQDDLLAQARALRETILGPARREQEHARLRLICEGQARQARDYWPAFHACWAANSTR